MEEANEVVWDTLNAICLAQDEPLSANDIFLNGVRHPKFTWSELLFEAVRNKVICIVAEVFLKNAENKSFLPWQVSALLTAQLFYNRERIRILEVECHRIGVAFTEASVRAVATKGVVLNSTIYGGRGIRQMSDVDYMIATGDGVHVDGLMRQCGYGCGNYDYDSRTVVPYSREWIIRHKLNPDHIPVYVKPLRDGPVNHVRVDFATSLVWARSGIKDPVDAALSSAELVRLHSGVEVLALNFVYQFVFVCLHLFREAWLEKWGGKDVNLAKFLDVLQMWKLATSPQVAEVRQIIARFSLEKPMCWVACHTDTLFGTCIAGGLALESSRQCSGDGKKKTVGQFIFSMKMSLARKRVNRCIEARVLLDCTWYHSLPLASAMVHLI